MRRRAAVASVAVVLLAVAGLLAWRWWTPESGLGQAMGTLPDDTLRATFTDWEAVRAAVGGEGLDAGSSRRAVDAFLRRGFDRDLVSTSAVADSTVAMRDLYGLSPLDVAWEALGQSRRGQVVVLRTEDVDLRGVEQRLRSLGYQSPPGGIGTGGTWAGSADLVATLDPSLTPVFQNVAVLEDRGLVLLSDRADAVTRAADVARGDAEPLDEPGLVAEAGEPVTAVLWASDFACEDLSMSSADAEDQRVAQGLVQDVGGVSPVTGLVVGRQAGGTIRVVLEFEDDDQASENLQPRVDLAAGEAPGQGGSFADRFTVASGEADGDTVVLDLEPTSAQFVFSDLTSGPVLFATC